MKRAHWLWMAAACLFMLAFALIGPKVGVTGLAWLGFLICPLLHILMMVGLFGGKHKGCQHGADSE